MPEKVGVKGAEAGEVAFSWTSISKPQGRATAFTGWRIAAAFGRSTKTGFTGRRTQEHGWAISGRARALAPMAGRSSTVSIRRTPAPRARFLGVEIRPPKILLRGCHTRLTAPRPRPLAQRLGGEGKTEQRFWSSWFGGIGGARVPPTLDWTWFAQILARQGSGLPKVWGSPTFWLSDACGP